MSHEPPRTRFLPTLSLILVFVPAVPAAILIALSTGGNWAFLILGGITYVVSQLLCGTASLILGILSIRKGWGRKRGIAAVALSSFGLLMTLTVVGAFCLRGLLI